MCLLVLYYVYYYLLYEFTLKHLLLYICTEAAVRNVSYVTLELETEINLIINITW